MLASSALSASVNDYDGDGKSDPAVYTTSDGYWTVLLSSLNYAVGTQPTSGNITWRTAPGDYDGDGKADIVLMSAAGAWQGFLSGSGYTPAGTTFGAAGAVPVSADYDGDGITDLAYYEKASSTWGIWYSGSGQAVTGPWGEPNSIPVPGDYDGDGKADLALYHNGYWSICSTAGYILFNHAGPWGGPDDIPVSGDFDGDGKSDAAVYHNGYWSICSMAGYILFDNAGPWGAAEYAPVPGDFDGDGKSDATVYRDGYWSICSMAGYIIADNGGPFGGGHAIPVGALLATVSVSASPTNGGTVTGSGVYLAGSLVTVSATAASGWIFNGWSDGNMAASRAVTVTPGGVTLTANFIRTLVFMAFGDSITYGSGSSSGGPATGYPKLLENKLTQNYVGIFHAVNKGIPGEDTFGGLDRFAATLDATDPDLVLLMEGTNDCFDGNPYDAIEENLRAMIQIALNRGIPVILATIPPVISNAYYDRSEQMARIVGFNPRIYVIAADYNIPVAQVFEGITSVPNWENLLMDQASANHPNDAGYQVVRDAFYVHVSAGWESGQY